MSIDYLAALIIQSTLNQRIRKLALILSVIGTAGILAYFKYANFFIQNLVNLSRSVGHDAGFSPLEIILPIGLSFHTFQSLGYVFEVYWRRQTAEKNFLRYMTFVMFFPQLVAGPIERPQSLIPQFDLPKIFSRTDFSLGVNQVTLGLFKKTVLADRLSLIADQPYNKFTVGFPLLLSVFSFSLQIYCDFSGYSDIAIGSAKCLGFDLMRNFNRPYFARSLSEFWRRWHISLSLWFRDYIYIPLGGNKRKSRNSLIVFALSGLWHGANWNFVIWGLLNGLLTIMESSLSNSVGGIFKNASRILKGTYVFILSTLCWIFFRAPDFGSACAVLRTLFKLNYYDRSSLYGVLTLNGGTFSLAFLTFAALLLLIHDLTNEKSHKDNRENIHYVSLVLMSCLIVWSGVAETGSFIYFQF